MSIKKGFYWALFVFFLFSAFSCDYFYSRMLEKIKKATVLIVMEAGKESKSGSGFLIYKEGNKGLIMTNAHVVETSRSGGRVTVVLNSGTSESITLEAKIVGLNLASDLAVLEVNASKLPEPVSINKDNEKAKETQEVFIFGFPFGVMLATNRVTPNITISRGNISSIRKDINDQELLIQIDGGIHMGNSGGPIVTSQGKLIGVAVAAIKETNIGFAIPPRAVEAMVSGHFTNLTYAQDGSNLLIKGDIIDPFNRIKGVSLLMVPESEVSLGNAITANGNWKKISNKGEIFDGNLLGNKKGEIEIETGLLKPKEVYVSQIILKTASDDYFYQSPFRFAFRKNESQSASKKDDILLIGPNVSPLKDELAGNTKKGPESPPPTNNPSESETGKEEEPENVEIIKTPSTIEDVILAAGGSYLIFRFSQKPQLGVFNVNTRQWQDRISVPDMDFLLTANRSKIFIGLPISKRMLRIDLVTHSEDLIREMPYAASLKAIAVGWDSYGAPLLAITSEKILLLDGDTFDSLPHKLTGAANRIYVDPKDEIRLRASANNMIFTFWGTHYSPEGVHLILLNDRELNCLYEHDTAGYLAPNPKGDLIYTNQRGIYNLKLKVSQFSEFRNRHFMPSVMGDYFLDVLYDREKASLDIRRVSDYQSVLNLPNLKEMVNDIHPMGFHRPLLSGDKRYYLYPDLGILITIPFSDDRLYVRKITIEN